MPEPSLVGKHFCKIANAFSSFLSRKLAPPIFISYIEVWHMMPATAGSHKPQAMASEE